MNRIFEAYKKIIPKELIIMINIFSFIIFNFAYAQDIETNDNLEDESKIMYDFEKQDGINADLTEDSDIEKSINIDIQKQNEPYKDEHFSDAPSVEGRFSDGKKFETELYNNGFIIEPILGIVGSSYKQKLLYDYLTYNNDGSASGGMAGLKLGLYVNNFMFGIDLYSQAIELDPDLSVEKSDATIFSRGIFVGYDNKINCWRFWGGYYKSDFEDDSNKSTFKGRALKLGVGYRILRYLSLNLEIDSLVYDKVESASGDKINLPYITSEISIYELNFVNVMFTVSFPINIPAF